MPTVFHIDDDDTVRMVDQGTEPAGLKQVFATFEQVEQLSADWPLRRLVAIWNKLSGVQRVSRFENRAIGLHRIWRALSRPYGTAMRTSPSRLPMP